MELKREILTDTDISLCVAIAAAVMTDPEVCLKLAAKVPQTVPMLSAMLADGENMLARIEKAVGIK